MATHEPRSDVEAAAPKTLASRLLPPRAALLALYVVTGIAAGAISLAFGQSKNYGVFCFGAQDLLRHSDLYVRHIDVYKYSPAFALFFVPFLWLPIWVGGPLWSLLNFGAVAYALDGLYPGDGPRSRKALAFAWPGIVLATDGDQSNLLVVGLVLLAFRAFEKNKHAAGSSLVVLGALIKLFPIAGAIFAAFHPGKHKTAFWLVVFLAAGALVPLVVLSPRELWAQYVSWKVLLSHDYPIDAWSLGHMLSATLGRNVQDAPVQLVGMSIVGLVAGLGLWLGTTPAFRQSFAAMLLLFLVLFNHRTEYATCVISAVAVGMWMAEPGRKRWHYPLGVLALLSPGPWPWLVQRVSTAPLTLTDFLTTPRVFHPLRMVPLLLVWLLMCAALLAPLVAALRQRFERSAQP